MKTTRITSVEKLLERIEKGRSLGNTALVSLDLAGARIDWSSTAVDGAVFLGCTFRKATDEELLRQRGAIVMTAFPDLPYSPFRASLYTPDELMEGGEKGRGMRLDRRVYLHFLREGGTQPTIKEALMQRIHDHSIDMALAELLSFDRHGDPTRRVVGFMGGHHNARGSEFYIKTAQLARLVARDRYLVATGGGPGIMEAANLGAYMSGYGEHELQEAIRLLAEVPFDTGPEYVERAWRVRERYPAGGKSLSVPTWFYGFETLNIFASDIAKYFSNSIREDGLLTIALYGVIFSPGGSGTRQEIFMDASQNDYGALEGKYEWFSPMLFLGTDAYEKQFRIYQLVRQTAREEVRQMMTLSDDVGELHQFLKEHKPFKRLHGV